MTGENPNNSAEEELKEFLYIIVHDLKNPVRGIQQASDWLVQDYRDTLDENGNSLIELLQNKSILLTQMIDELHNYFKVFFKPNQLEQIEFTKVLEVASDSVQKILKKDTLPIKIILKNKFQKDFFLLSDTMKLTQVVSDLLYVMVLLNSEIQLEINIDISHFVHEEMKSHVCIFQCDTILFDESRLATIFKPFQELKVNDKKINTFMKLALAKKIIESFGGKISATVLENKVFQFSFFYPL